MAEDRIAERQRVFKQYKEDVKERGKPFFPFAMWHDTVMSLRRRRRHHRARVRVEMVGPGRSHGHRVGMAREAVRRARRPGDVQLRAAPRLVLLLPLLPAADLQVALVGDPRHGRHPDDPAAPPDRHPVHRHAARASPAASGRSRWWRASSSILSMGILTYRGATAKEALGTELLKEVPKWAKKQGFVGNKQAVAGAKLFASVGCLELPHLPRERQPQPGRARPRARGRQGQGRVLPDRPPEMPVVRDEGEPDAAVREPGQREPHAARDLPRGLEGTQEVAAGCARSP